MGRRQLRYLALAADGDGTLTVGGRLARRTAGALERLRAAGGQVLLVTGETPEELAEFPRLDLFDRVVAENGAVLCGAAAREVKPLHDPPPPELVGGLRRRGVRPLRVGRVILATERRWRRAVEAVLRELGLPWHAVLNRRDVMVLPEGVSKATGLAAALKPLRLSPRRVVGVGDGENDAALLEFCGLGVAVANAVPQLKARAGLLTRGRAGKGVAELIDWMLRSD